MRVAALLLTAVLAAGANAQRPIRRFGPQPDVPPVLRTAIANANSVRMIGRRTVQFLSDAKNLRHDEIVIRDGFRVRIEFPAGSAMAGQVIVEDANERRHYLPGKNEIRVSAPRREDAFQRIVALMRRRGPRRMSVSAVPGDIVAGQRTEQVVVSDPDGNVIQRMFIEPRTGAILKRQLFDAVGGQIGYFEFTDVDLNPAPFDPSLFRLEHRGATTVTPVANLRELCRRNDMAFLMLPPATGYRLEHARMSPLAGQPVLVQIYNSDLGKLSLYQLKRSISVDRLKELAQGKFRVYSWNAAGRTFVMVGSLEEAALSQLAQRATIGTP